jgi:hypothetical protein
MTGDNDVPAALPADLALAFLPLHKRAFGMALGLATGLFFAVLTIVHLARRGTGPEPTLSLLGEYFYGYTVSLPGAVVALAWGFVVGFVAGWFVAFMRNMVLAVSLWLGRNRGELEATRDFLDHI